MDANVFERCLIWVICRKAEELDVPLNESQLAQGVFDVGHPVNAWRSTRNSTRELSLQEAYRLSEKIGIDFDVLCWDVRNVLRSGWKLEEQDVSLHKPTSGRPSKKKHEKKSPPKDEGRTERSAPVADARSGQPLDGSGDRIG